MQLRGLREEERGPAKLFCLFWFRPGSAFAFLQACNFCRRPVRFAKRHARRVFGGVILYLSGCVDLLLPVEVKMR